MSEAISDVFAFVAKNADYWTEFLRGTEYPEGLDERQELALDAARRHVDETVVALLHLAADRLFVALGPEKLAKKRPQASATERNRLVWLLPKSQTWKRVVWDVKFSLESNELEPPHIELYASINTRKREHEGIVQRLAEQGLRAHCTGSHVSLDGLPLGEGTRLDDLATAAVAKMRQLLASVR